MAKRTLFFLSMMLFNLIEHETTCAEKQFRSFFIYVIMLDSVWFEGASAKKPISYSRRNPLSLYEQLTPYLLPLGRTYLEIR